LHRPIGACVAYGRELTDVVLASEIPKTIEPAKRLEEYFELVQLLSEQRDPGGLLNAYRQRAQFVVRYDHMMSFSRLDMPPGQALMTRSSRWTTPINPWQEREKLPVITDGMVTCLMEAARPVKIDQIEIDPADPVAEQLEGMNSMLAVPIFHEGNPTYLVCLLRKEPSAFTLDELCTFLLTANLIGHTTSQLKLAEELRAAYAALDREFHAVGQIQRELLPAEFPSIPGISIATHYETSTRAGGDYYDFFPLGHDRFAVLIADVSGHGPSAAVVMSMMHAILHADPNVFTAPADALRFLNRRLYDAIVSGQFATAFLAFIDPAGLKMQFANAGHNPPRLLRKPGEVIALKAVDGLPLAVAPQLDVTTQEQELQRGDRLLLYTDGITETFDHKGRMFGTELLDDALRRCRATSTGIVDCVIGDVHAFSRGAPPSDDRTLVVISIDPPES
jgi:sigma-B regulation protein RsbU (phosphoserine phosphatase)